MIEDFEERTKNSLEEVEGQTFTLGQKGDGYTQATKDMDIKKAIPQFIDLGGLSEI